MSAVVGLDLGVDVKCEVSHQHDPPVEDFFTMRALERRFLVQGQVSPVLVIMAEVTTAVLAKDGSDLQVN